MVFGRRMSYEMVRDKVLEELGKWDVREVFALVVNVIPEGDECSFLRLLPSSQLESALSELSEDGQELFKKEYPDKTHNRTYPFFRKVGSEKIVLHEVYDARKWLENWGGPIADSAIMASLSGKETSERFEKILSEIKKGGQ